MRFRPCVPPAISPQAKTPSSVVSALRVDHEAAVLVVEDGVRVELLPQRVDACPAEPAQHVRQGDVGVGLGDAGRVEPHRRAPVGRLDPAAGGDLVDDRLRDDVARAERVGELLAVGVEEHRTVGARRLGDRVALPSSAARHRRSGGTAARRGRAPRLRPRARCASPRPSRSGGSSRARRAPRPRRSTDRRRRGRPLPASTSTPAVGRLERRPPAAVARARARRGRAARAPSPSPGAVRLAERLRDRVARAVADLERAACAWRRRSGRRGKPPSLAGEGDTELLEPADRRRPVAGERRDERRVGRVARGAHHVRGVGVGIVVGATAAWIPPCAFEELFAWSVVFVATATRAPARAAATPAARPEAPLPTTSTSSGAGASHPDDV